MLSEFAKLLGLPMRHAEDALYSERAARAVLTRRSFFAAGGALAAGSAFSFAKPEEAPIVTRIVDGFRWRELGELPDGSVAFIHPGDSSGRGPGGFYIFSKYSAARADRANVLMAGDGHGRWIRMV